MGILQITSKIFSVFLQEVGVFVFLPMQVEFGTLNDYFHAVLASAGRAIVADLFVVFFLCLDIFFMSFLLSLLLCHSFYLPHLLLCFSLSLCLISDTVSVFFNNLNSTKCNIQFAKEKWCTG